MKRKLLKNTLISATILSSFGVITSCTPKEDINQKEEVTLKSISVDVTKAKTKYVEGEAFTSKGLVVKAIYSDLSDKNVTGFTTSIKEGDKLEVGEHDVRVYYKEGKIEASTTYKIEVKSNEPEKVVLNSIVIEKTPTQMVYNLGDKFNPAGMVVKGIYSDNTTKEIKDYKVNLPERLDVNDTLLSVTYEEDGKSYFANIAAKLVIETEDTNPNFYDVAEVVKFKVDGKLNPNIETTGVSLSTWSSDGHTFDRLRCNTDAKKTIVFKHNYKDLKDKSKAGFMSIMNISRGGTTIEISKDKKTWTTIAKSEPKNNNIRAVYKYRTKEINGLAATDGKNQNVYYAYFNIGEFLDDKTEEVYIKFGYEKPVDGWLGADREGTDLIDRLTFFDRLDLSKYKVGVDLKSVAIKDNPTKVDYIEEETFDATGLKLEATFSDDSKAIISSGIIIDKVGGLKVEDKVVKASFKFKNVTKSIDIPINVKAREAKMTGIKVTTNPTKVEYEEGDVFDPTGMVVKATYDNGEELEVNGYTYSKEPLKIENTEVEISYNEFKTKVAIKVSEKKRDKLIASDYDVAKELKFNDASNYKLSGGAAKGASRKFKDTGEECIRLRSNNVATRKINVEYEFESTLDLKNAGFRFTGLNTRLGTTVKLSTNGTDWTYLCKYNPETKTYRLPADHVEFNGNIVNGSGKTDSNMHDLYYLIGDKLNGNKKVYIEFGYEKLPDGTTFTGITSGEGADIFGSVVFYSRLDLSHVK